MLSFVACHTETKSDTKCLGSLISITALLTKVLSLKSCSFKWENFVFSIYDPFTKVKRIWCYHLPCWSANDPCKLMLITQSPILFQTIMEQFNPCLRNFIAMGKNYEKALSSKYLPITSPAVSFYHQASRQLSKPSTPSRSPFTTLHLKKMTIFVTLSFRWPHSLIAARTAHDTAWA